MAQKMKFETSMARLDEIVSELSLYTVKANVEKTLISR